MREMKNSGVAWIGEIPNDWRVIANKYLMRKVKNIREHYSGEDVLSLTMNGVIVRDLENPSGKMPATFDGYQFVEKDNLLMCLFDIDVTPRCIGLIKNNGVCSPAYSQFELQDGADANYYYYYYLNLDNSKELLHLAKNLRHSLTEEQLGFVPTAFPSLDEQRKVASILDKKLPIVTRLIDNEEEQIEKLKQYKQSLITEVVTKGLNPDAEMKDSGVEWIGEIPTSFSMMRMKHLGKVRNGLTYSPENLCDDGTLVLRSSNVQNGKLCFEDNVYVDSDIKEELMVKKGDILICSRNGSRALIGKSAIIDCDLRASFGAFMMIFRSIHNPKYIYYILNSNIFSYYLGTYLTATINQLTGANFNGMVVPFCSDVSIQNEIVAYLDEQCAKIDKLIEIKQSKIAKLNEYKKSLIYEYVTGKKEVV